MDHEVSTITPAYDFRTIDVYAGAREALEIGATLHDLIDAVLSAYDDNAEEKSLRNRNSHAGKTSPRAVPQYMHFASTDGPCKKV
jgi:hypothetical protein